MRKSSRSPPPRRRLAALHQQPFDLVLVNRVLDADGSAGLDVVEQIKTDTNLRELPVMLVSNYEDAQRQAVEKGALPGFGKATLGQPHMLRAWSRCCTAS